MPPSHVSFFRSKIVGARFWLLFGLLTVFVSLSAYAQRPLGIDVSHWQGTSINWTSVKNAGITFAWCKATEGTGYTDDTFVVNEAMPKQREY